LDFGNYHYELERIRELLEEEEVDAAWELARELYETARGDPEVVCAYCDAALSAGSGLKAVSAARKFLKGGEEDIEVLEWLARGQWELHMTEGCRQTCRRILALESGNYTALDYGLAAVQELGDVEVADEFLAGVREHRSQDPHLLFQSAVVRSMRGEEEWAQGIFEEFLRREPDQPGAYLHLMRLHCAAERFIEVSDLFQAARARGIEHEDLRIYMGIALKGRDREREAAHHFIRAIRLAPDIPEAHLYLGQILRGEGHPLLAMWMLARELRADDTHPAVHAEMAWCAEDLERYDDAVAMIKAAVERAPEWGIYLHSLSELLMNAGRDSSEAREAADRAIELEPEYAAGWQVLGRLAAKVDRFDEAERCLKRAVNGKDTTAADEGWLGLVLLERGREEDARPLLERAVRTYPFWNPAGTALGRIRGNPLPLRFEIRLALKGPAGEGLYRVIHVVAADEAGAREEAMLEPTETVEDVRMLGFEVDHGPGVVWDSGPSRRRNPGMPPLHPED